MPFHKVVYSSWFMACLPARQVHRFKKETTNHQLPTTNRKSYGFTLIELLVVISILAVLSGGLLYSTNNVRDKGKDARRKQDLKAISAALISYRADHSNKYPPTTTPTIIFSFASDDTDWLTDLSGTYMAKLPHDPANPTTTTVPLATDTNCQGKSFIYCYTVSADQKTFTLWSQLENANDQELRSNTNAICQDPVPASTSFNYCLKSPQ